MLKALKKITLRMIAGANIATVVILLLIGYSDYLSPVSHPTLANIGLAFPVFLLINLGFLILWLIIKPKGALIPFVGFLLCYVPVRKYMPLNVPHDPPEGAIKVISYNIRNFGEGDVSADEPHPILDFLEKENADIVCLQEYTPGVTGWTRIDAVLNRIYPYRDSTLHVKGGNALGIYSKFPIVGKERISYESKGNLSAAYRLKIDGEEVIVINNHLETTGITPEERSQFKSLVKGDLQTDTARKESQRLIDRLAEGSKIRAPQAEAVARYVRAHKGQSIILCGDFNDGPISYCHRVLAKELNDCYIATGNGPGISYNRYGFYVRIDNIMCSDDWVPYACKVTDEVILSDHYPILCWLKKRQKP